MQSKMKRKKLNENLKKYECQSTPINEEREIWLTFPRLLMFVAEMQLAFEVDLHFHFVVVSVHSNSGQWKVFKQNDSMLSAKLRIN